MTTVKHLNGAEITQDVIEEIKRIARSRYSELIYNGYFSFVDTPSSLADIHNVDLKDENVILGIDWFLCFNISGRQLILSEWVAEENPSRTVNQSLEMYTTIRDILASSNVKRVNAYLRHDTSYQFYRLLLQREYIDVIDDLPSIDICPKEEEKHLEDQIMENDTTIRELLDAGQIIKEQEQYIFHDVTFEITEKFQKKYGSKKAIT